MEEQLPYFITMPDNSIKKGIIESGKTLEDVLRQEGITQSRKDLSISMDNVIVDAQSLIESRNEAGIVNLAISLKVENG